MNLRLINNSQLKSKRTILRKNQTLSESKIWYYLRNRQFHGIKFFRQYSIGNYILDFYTPKLHLGIEIDGGQHNDPLTIQYDIERNNFLREKGICVIRFWNNEVIENVEGVLLKIEQQIITPPNSSYLKRRKILN